MRHGNGSGGNGERSYAVLVTWLFWTQVAAVPVRTAGSLTFCRLLLWLLLVFLLQSIEQLVKRRLQRLCCLCAVKLPFQTFCFQFVSSLNQTIPTKSVVYFKVYHIILTGWFAHKPHRWCCQTPFASPPLFLQFYLRAQRCLASHPRTPATSPSGSRSLIFLPDFWLL